MNSYKTQQYMTEQDFDACFAIEQAEFQHKCESYAQSFFFSFSPDDWSYEDLTFHLRSSQEDSIEDMACLLNRDQDDLAVWEPFEDFSPSWVADQMDMMVAQLKDTFK